MFVTDVTVCRAGQFQCGGNTSHVCIPNERLCDGAADCADNSDEHNCGMLAHCSSQSPNTQNA